MPYESGWIRLDLWGGGGLFHRAQEKQDGHPPETILECPAAPHPEFLSPLLPLACSRQNLCLIFSVIKSLLMQVCRRTLEREISFQSTLPAGLMRCWDVAGEGAKRLDRSSNAATAHRGLQDTKDPAAKKKGNCFQFGEFLHQGGADENRDCQWNRKDSKQTRNLTEPSS